MIENRGLRRCETLWSARDMASLALSAERQRHTENMFHMLLRLSFIYKIEIDNILTNNKIQKNHIQENSHNFQNLNLDVRGYLE